MSGVTLSDLSKYHQGAMKWFKDGLVSEHNRLFAQTEDAGAVSFWPLGGTPLEGKVKFSFKETPPASGDKGPENPSVIAGVSAINVTRCGKNLLRRPYWSNGATTAGITFAVNSDGTVTINGTATGNAWFSVSDTTPYEQDQTSRLRLSRGKPYTASLRVISGSLATNGMVLQVMNQMSGLSALSSGCSLNAGSSGGAKGAASLNWNSVYAVESKIKARFGVWKDAVATNLVVAPQLEYGNEDTEYEPYEGIDSTINLGNTYYGGEIDLATGVMTVTHHCFTVDGNTNYSTGIGLGENTGSYRLAFYPDKERVKNPYAIGDAIYCDRFPVGGNASEVIAVGLSSVNLQITLLKSRLGLGDGASFAEVQTAFKTFFASHPTKFVYPISTPFTVQLTPLQLTALAQKDKYTPRINTVYTDADSIQIRYRKSLIHDEDEKVQAIVALGGNV